MHCTFFPGQFREKASILHKMAKHKCKEEAANANGLGELRWFVVINHIWPVSVSKIKEGTIPLK